jgi:hypothetical protein
MSRGAVSQFLTLKRDCRARFLPYIDGFMPLIVNKFFRGFFDFLLYVAIISGSVNASSVLDNEKMRKFPVIERLCFALFSYHKYKN